jgi:hypothetical protein
MRNLLLLLLTTVLLQAEDFSIEVQKLNDQFDIPKIDQEMSYEEFDLLSTKFGLKDIGYSLIVPGYVHYKAHDEIHGHAVLGIRSIAYAVIGYTYWDATREDGNAELTQEKKDIIYYSTLVALSTWLYDWIRGINVLEDKQHQIRYKYAMKLSLVPVPAKDGSVTTKIGIGASF